MEGRISFYFAHGLATSSQKTYKSGENRYLKFCSSSNVDHLPICESVLCKFVAFLADESLQHRTIKTYLFEILPNQIRPGRSFSVSHATSGLCPKGCEASTSGVGERKQGTPPYHPGHSTQIEGGLVGIGWRSRHKADLGGMLPMLLRVS